MRRVSFYGKGGVGKSTIAAGVSLHLARSGRRVLHVGCDPKADSTLALVPDEQSRHTVLARLGEQRDGQLQAADLIMPGLAGIGCIESGGPEPGVGCGGRAVAKALEVCAGLGLFDDAPVRYDVTVFDVLGDVVCGGFAAPLQRAPRSLVAIVMSEEMMAGLAATNIARACLRHATDGVALAGLVVNLRSNEAPLEPLQRLADAMGTRVISIIPRDPAVGLAELRGRSIVDDAPQSPVAKSIRFLAELLMDMEPTQCAAPTPLTPQRVRQVLGTSDEDDEPKALELPPTFPRQYGLD